MEKNATLPTKIKALQDQIKCLKSLRLELSDKVDHF